MKQGFNIKGIYKKADDKKQKDVIQFINRQIKECDSDQDIPTPSTIKTGLTS